jgi:hypothetical protein
VFLTLVETILAINRQVAQDYSADSILGTISLFEILYALLWAIVCPIAALDLATAWTFHNQVFR